MKKVFVVILNFNGGDITVECINSLLKQKLEKIELTIVVVDNGSSDNSAKAISNIHDLRSKIQILRNKENLGFTGGCNEGMRYALKSGADYILLLNNDTVVDENLITNLVEKAKPDMVGAVVPKIYFEKGYEFHKEKYKKDDLGKIIWYAGGEMDFDNLIGKNIGVDEVDRGQFDITRETELATGCCILLKKETLNAVGLFDDEYFLYYEDADLTQRIREKGFKIIYEPSAVVWHKNAESSGVGSELHDYYISRNRLLFGMKYAPLRTRAALIKESFNILKTGRSWQKKGVRDYYLRKFGRGTFNI